MVYDEKYKKHLISKALSTNTVNSYIYDLHNFNEYIKNYYSIDISETKKAQVLTYLVNLQKKGRSSSTISRTISALKNYYEFLKMEKIVKENPVTNIASPKPVKKLPMTLSEEEINTLMNIPKKDSFKGARDSSILELLYSSGIKVTELININIMDVNINIGVIKIDGKKSRLVPLSEHAKNSIINYLNNFRKLKLKNDENNQLLFINILGEAISRQGVWKILKYYEREMNINKELSPQILRNSFAVHLLSHGADFSTVKELLGLTSVHGVQNYMQNLKTKSLEVFKNTFPRA